jgi:hypothetical protein
MAQTINPVVATVAGAVHIKTLCTAETVTLTASTAQSAAGIGLKLSKVMVYFENATSVATVISTGAGDNYSEISQGAKTLTTLGTSTSTIGNVIVGGKSFESARFLTDDNAVIFTIATTAASVYVSAFMLP